MKNISFIILSIILILSTYIGNGQSDSVKIDVYSNNAEELTKQSLIEYQRQNYSDAINYANRALIIYKENRNPKKEGEILEKLGIYYAEFSDYENSIEFLLASLKIAEAQNDSSSIYSRIFNIGTTFIEAKNYEKGISFLYSSISYYNNPAHKSPQYLIACYSNLGVGYYEMNEPDSAMHYYEMAINVAESSQINYSTGAPLLNIGDIYIEQSKPDTALIHLNKALASFKKEKDKRGEWHAYFNIAKAKAQLGETDTAILLIEKSITHFKSTNDLNYLAKATKNLSDIYHSQKEYEKALEYKDQLLQINKQISKTEISNQINNLELQYKIEKVTSENEAQLEILHQKKRISTLRWYIATGILIILSLLSILFYTRTKNQKQLVEAKLDTAKSQQEELKNELDYKTKELESFALHIVQKNDFLNEIKKTISEIKSQSTKTKIDRLNELHLKINQSLRKNKDLELFQERIEEVNSKFFNTLIERYPELTKKERRLCALLKLDLSSKEIASLNDISVGAVTMARYRLRKKLGMANETSFRDFFEKL